MIENIEVTSKQFRADKDLTSYYDDTETIKINIKA